MIRKIPLVCNCPFKNTFFIKSNSYKKTGKSKCPLSSQNIIQKFSSLISCIRKIPLYSPFNTQLIYLFVTVTLKNTFMLMAKAESL